jgi:20S proteasome alpha/beta subunit
MFDLQKHDFTKSSELGYTFELKLPDGSNSGAKLTVIGDLSPVVKNFARKRFAEYQQRQAIAKRKGREDEMTLEEAEETAVEAALVRLVNWEGITDNGKPVEFSKDKAREVLTQHSFIREQVLEEAGFVQNFTPKTLKA